MAYCILTLYRQPILTKEKNFIIEDFNDYLATLTKLQINELQYLKPALHTTIKLTQKAGTEIQQQMLMKNQSASTIAYFNYLKVQYVEVVNEEITNTNQPDGFYFIDAWNTWKGENCYEIEITMDVLNTLGVPSATNKYFNWDYKTKILREHQNRFKLDISNNPHWSIDKKSEGITTYQYKIRDDVVLEDAQVEMKWYLMFRNAADAAPDSSSVVELLIIPEHDITLTPEGQLAMNRYGISNFDLKNPRIIKIIELPYNPSIAFKYEDADEYSITSANAAHFDFTGGSIIKLKDWDFILQNTFTPYLNDTTVDHLDPMYYHTISELVEDFEDDSKMDKSAAYEPKLYHSDFYNVKYLYDSFAKLVKFEEFDFSESDTFKIKFVPSVSASSKFAFEFQNARWKNGKEDFFKWLTANRNNDLPLWSYGYYTYLLSSEGWNNFKQETSLAKQAFGFISKQMTGQSNVLSGLTDIGTMCLNWIDMEASIEQTKDILRNQAASVSGSDDLRLFNLYSENKLHKITYNVSDEFRKLLFDMFYYTGYIQNKMGVPNTTSRYWFNYVKCEPILKNVLLNMPSGVLEEYKNKWREGSTVFHKHSTDWDLNQEYENIEVDLL